MLLLHSISFNSTIKPSCVRQNAFTIVEMVFSIGVILLIILMAVASVYKHQRIRDKSECAGNLRAIYDNYVADEMRYGELVTARSSSEGGTREYTNDGTMTYKHFQSILNYPNSFLSGLVCPMDVRSPATNRLELSNSNISYFITVNYSGNNPGWIMAGDRNISDATGKISVLKDTNSLYWREKMGLHGNSGYILLADGSTHYCNNSNMIRYIVRATNEQNRISIP